MPIHPTAEAVGTLGIGYMDTEIIKRMKLKAEDVIEIKIRALVRGKRE